MSALTVRGRWFLLVGLATLAGAAVLRQQDLLRIAVLLIALPLVAVATVARLRHRVHSTRSVRPGRVPAGQEARVVLRMENTSLVPTGLLMAEDTLPAAMRARPRFLVDRLPPHGHRDVTYRVRSHLRGRYPIGPLTARVADPFGMCEMTRSFDDTDQLTVIPVVEHLPAVDLGGEWTGSSDSHLSSIPAAGEDDIATREYRHGDPLHRVHWRSTARRGELMVRREEQPRQTQASLLLDTRSAAHVGHGPESSLEWVVSAGASIGTHLLRRGFSLRTLTDTAAGFGGMTPDVISPVPDVEGLLLDGLAMLSASSTRTLTDAGAQLATGLSDGLVVAVLGRLSSGDAEQLARHRRGTTTAIAVLLATESWLGRRCSGEAERSAALLRNAGWRVVTVTAGDRLADVWTETARTNVPPLTPTAAGGPS